MLSFLYRIVDLLKVMCKNSESKSQSIIKNKKYCFNCNSKLKNKDVYFAFDNRFCSEECREYYII